MAAKKCICVKDVMKSNFGMINGKATIKDALSEMNRLQTAVLIVNKRNEDDEYGILLVSDIARKVMAKDKAASRVNVFEIMTKPAVCVDPEIDIRYCARLMTEFNLTRVIVEADDEILGTLSPRALVLEGLAAIVADE